MGLGIATLGCGFLLTYEVGGGIFAALLLAYGFYLASGTNKRFLFAAFFALLLIPHSVFRLLDISGVFVISDYPALNGVVRAAFYSAWLCMSYFYLTAIKQIALENENRKMANKAGNRLYFTAAVLTGFIILLIFGDAFYANVKNAFYIAQYAMILWNTIFLHTCFIMITTERLDKKDKERIAAEAEKQAKKQNKK